MVWFILVLWGFTFNESHYLLLKLNELLFKSDSSDYSAHNLQPAQLTLVVRKTTVSHTTGLDLAL